MRKTIATILALIIILTMVAPAAAQDPGDAPDVFIAFTGLDPVTSQVTSKADLQSAQATKQANFLEAAHTTALEAVGASEDDKIYDYTHAFSGFAAKLSEEQAVELARRFGAG